MQDPLATVLKAGSLLVIETGFYSDRNWHGPIKMLVTKTKQELADEFCSEWEPGPDEKYLKINPDADDFLPWLIRKRYAEDFPCGSWHVGKYGVFDP